MCDYLYKFKQVYNLGKMVFEERAVLARLWGKHA